jgi:hypothetical protein
MRPRVPMEKPGVTLSGRERPHLRKADEEQKRAVVRKGIGYAAIAVDVVVAIFAGIAFLAGFTGLGIAISVFMTIVFMLGFVASFASAKGARARAVQAMNDAMDSAVVDVLAAKGAMTAPALADQMGITREEAEKVLDRLPAKSAVHSVVDDRAADGLVRYRLEDPTRTMAMEEAADAETAAFDARLAEAMKKKGQA